MTKNILIAALLFSSTLLPAQVSGSYQRLSGARLSRFLKTKGLSESGRNVSFLIPATVFPVKSKSKGRRFRLQYKGLRVEFDHQNPYWIQTRRKLLKSSKGKVLVKGRVRRRRNREGKFTHYMYANTLQKIGRGAKKKSKKRRNR